MQEKLSAMMDGEWDDHELEQVIAAMDQDEDMATSWRDYHLIGDAMNRRAVLSGDFLNNFSARLEAEPTILAPHALRHRRGFVPGKRWVALSMAASVALVSATAWYVGNLQGAATVGPVVVAANQPVPPAQVDEVNPYLVAHQALSGNPGFNHRAVILTGAEAERAVAGH